MVTPSAKSFFKVYFFLWLKYEKNIQTKLLSLHAEISQARGYHRRFTRPLDEGTRTRSTTDRQSKVQLTRRNSYRDFATIHKSKSNEYLRISTANMLDGTKRIPTNRFSSETLLASCTLVAFICFILTESMNITLLRQHCTLNLCSSISGVLPDNQDHRIQFIVEDTRQNLPTDCKCQ